MNPIIPNAGVHHIAVRTKDYDTTLGFYRDLLGMSVVRAWQAGDGRQLALLDIGNGACIEIIGMGADAPVPEAGQNHPWMHFAIATTDPDTVWQRAVDAGYTSVLDPKDVALGDMGARIAFFQGPNGEVIELFHQK